MKHIASISFGKDSLAMLLLILEKKLPLDEVVFYDTSMEFRAIYDIRDSVLPLLEQNNIKFTELRPSEPFEYKMYEKPLTRPKSLDRYERFVGWSWCGGMNRWGTGEKLKTIHDYCGNSIQYVGIACDEKERILKERNPNVRLPLNDFNICERRALEICCEHGYYWYEDGVSLYDILDRVSCWCCRNKNLGELQGIYEWLPEYWNKLVEMENRLGENMKKGFSLTELKERYIKQGSFYKKKNLYSKEELEKWSDL